MPGYIQIRDMLRKSIEDICAEVCKHRREVPKSYIREVITKTYPEVPEEDIQGLIRDSDNDDISFDKFAIMVLKTCQKNGLKHIKERGLPTYKDGYSFEEFILVLKMLYPFVEEKLPEARVKPIFKLIDTDNNGFIHEEELNALFDYILTADTPYSRSQSQQKGKLSFRSIERAKSVRKKLLRMISKFDKNQDDLFDQDEASTLLQTILHETPSDIEYTLLKIFKEKTDLVTYDEMANFLLEKHCGQISIQRLHLMSVYKSGSERVMNCNEFLKTLDIALGYFYTSIPENEMVTLFQEVDTDRTGYITYKEYFQFLSQYFGSRSAAFNCEKEESIVEGWIKDSSAKKQDKADRVPHHQTLDVLNKVFRYDMPEEALQVYGNLFKLMIDSQSLNIDEIKKMSAFLHMAITMLFRGHKTRNLKRSAEFLLSEEEFIDLIVDATEWAEIPADASALTFIFSQLDTDKDKHISYKCYIDFISQSIGNKTSIEIQDYFTSLLEQEENMPSATHILKMTLWKELRQVYFKNLPQGQQIMDLVGANNLFSQIVQEKIEEQEYLRWNYSRIDRNNDNRVSVEEFTSFLVSHSVELAFHKFHMEHTKGRTCLSLEEFDQILTYAFSYIPDSASWSPILKVIYHEIREEDQLSYKTFLGWVKKELA